MIRDFSRKGDLAVFDFEVDALPVVRSSLRLVLYNIRIVFLLYRKILFRSRVGNVNDERDIYTHLEASLIASLEKTKKETSRGYTSRYLELYTAEVLHNYYTFFFCNFTHYKFFFCFRNVTYIVEVRLSPYRMAKYEIVSVSSPVEFSVLRIVCRSLIAGVFVSSQLRKVFYALARRSRSEWNYRTCA